MGRRRDPAENFCGELGVARSHKAALGELLNGFNWLTPGEDTMNRVTTNERVAIVSGPRRGLLLACW
jgi:hypothetical protein